MSDQPDPREVWRECQWCHTYSEPPAITEQQQRIAELEAVLSAMMEARAWEDYNTNESCYYCKLCDGQSERSLSLSPSDVKHEPDCAVLVAKALLDKS
jgi:hypothetical protein